MKYGKVGKGNKVKRQTRELIQGMKGEWTDFVTVPLDPNTVTPYNAYKLSRNNYFTVMWALNMTTMGMVTHLMIRRHDNQMTNNWADKQRIKNMLVGEEQTAIEVYPAQKDLVDDANLAHLWVLPKSLPFGLHIVELGGQ